MFRTFFCVVCFFLSASLCLAGYSAGREAYSIKNYTVALREFKADDTPNSLYMVGVMYENGEGVEKDKKEAATWYRKSAEKGFAPAQYKLGQLYERGEGVPQDKQEALKWYKRRQGRDTAWLNTR